FCLFFFSSRRRHTRSLRDWSSDVCSSDLDETERGRIQADVLEKRNADRLQVGQRARSGHGEDQTEHRATAGKHYTLGEHLANQRSEERRVGKECRYWR